MSIKLPASKWPTVKKPKISMSWCQVLAPILCHRGKNDLSCKSFSSDKNKEIVKKLQNEIYRERKWLMLKTGCLDLKSTFNKFTSTYLKYYCKKASWKDRQISYCRIIPCCWSYFERLLKQFSVKLLINLFCIIFYWWRLQNIITRTPRKVTNECFQTCEIFNYFIKRIVYLHLLHY